jgi:hypothetical protein
MDRSEASNQAVSTLTARGAQFLGRGGQVLGIDEQVTVDRLAGLKASAASLDPNERFFVEGVLNAKDMEEHEGLFVWEGLEPLEDGRHELDLEALGPALRRVLAASEDLDAFVRLRIGSDRERLPPRSLHVARFDLILTPDRKRDEIVIVPADSSGPAKSPEDYRLRGLRLWDPEAAGTPPLSRIEGTWRWKWTTEKLEPGPWLILGWEGDSCRARPLLWTVQGKRLDSKDLDELQRAILKENAAQRSRAISAVFDRLARDPRAPEWQLVFSCLRLVEELPPTVLPVTVELAKHPAVAAMALVAAGKDLPRIWNLLEGLPFGWWQVGVRTWVRAATAWRRNILETAGRSDEAQKRAQRELRDFLDAAAVQGRFLGGVAEWVRVEVLGEPIRETQLSMGVEIPRHVLEQERQSLFHRAPERRWPTGDQCTRWLRDHEKDLPEGLLPLRKLTSGVPRFKRPVLAAPIVAALSSALDLPVDRPTFYELRRLSDFDREWFDAAHMLALRIAVGVLMEEQPEILR